MSSHLHLVRARPSHADSLARDVRRLDKEEWLAASGGKPVVNSLRQVISDDADDTWSVIDNAAECLAVWGVHESVHGYPWVGTAWMIATNEAARQVHSMHRMFHQGITRMHEHFPELEAWAYAKNILHHRWMLRMGFEDTGRTERMGLGMPFKQFTRTMPFLPPYL